MWKQRREQRSDGHVGQDVDHDDHDTCHHDDDGCDPATVASCRLIPEETAGPYPGDGTNGPNVLTQSGVVRSDIRSSFGSARTVGDGVPLTINLTVVDSKNGCKRR